MTVKHVVCVPFIHRPYMEAFIATVRMGERDDVHLVAIDNTVTNYGIMASHNLGLRHAIDVGAEWFTVCSAAIRFGEPGGLDWLQALDERNDHHVVEAVGVFGWHLIAFRVDLLRIVGEWDENFTPYGFDDIDMALRIQRARGVDGRMEQVWEKVHVDVDDEGMGHSIHLGGVTLAPERIEEQIAYFTRKWGRHPGDSHILAFDTPFGDPNNPISYWPSTVTA